MNQMTLGSMGVEKCNKTSGRAKFPAEMDRVVP